MNNAKAIKRQIEILAMIEQSPSEYSVADLCDIFGVETATIQRDLRELRGQGFAIHSSKNRLKLLKSLAERDYNSLLSLYLTLSNKSIGFPKNISLTIKKLKKNSLRTFVTIINAIEEHKEIFIKYYKIYDDETVERRLQPYHLIPTIRDWKLVAKSDGIFKQFFVDNIKEINITDNFFTRDKSFDIANMFMHSWETFRGEHPIIVKLLFSKKVAPIIKNTIWSETQIIEPQQNGQVLLTLTVGDLDEIMGWVMSWGGDVTVVEPEELRKIIVEKAREILNNE